MKFSLRALVSSMLIVPFFALTTVSPVFAAPESLQSMLFNTQQTSTLSGDSISLYSTLGLLINTGLSLLGIVFLLLILRAGLLWMTAQGEPKKVTKAKDIMITAVIGLVIIFSAYSISKMVFSSLGTVVG